MYVNEMESCMKNSKETDNEKNLKPDLLMQKMEQRNTKIIIGIFLILLHYI